jgi:hypothetical protein
MIEVADEFISLGTCITEQSEELPDINRWTGLVNDTYHSLLAIIKSRDIHRQTKIKLYSTLISSILWYRSKA